MWKTIAILLLMCCTGCICVNEPREVCKFRVVDVDGFKPSAGARVWVQPYAPIHPFWPPGDKGITDLNGEAQLSLPWREDFWFYMSSVDAVGYKQVKEPTPPMDYPWPAGVYGWVAYMKRDGL